MSNEPSGTYGTLKKKRLKKGQLIEAIEGSHGLISTIAKRLSVSRTTIRNYINKDQDLQKALEEETDSVLDFAESKLMKKMQEEDISAIKYYLSSKGQNRGYGNKKAEDIMPHIGKITVSIEEKPS